MANTKISDFTSGAPAQSTDEFVIARTGANFKLAASDIKTLVVGAGSVSVASGKTLTANNTLTLAGTDSTTMTFPSTSATLARTDAGNTFTGNQVVSSGSFGLSGNISAAAWTTNGIRYANSAATLTDTTSSGTVAAAYTDLFGGNTIAASNATTFTDYYTTWFNAATAGTNVTMTNKWALGLGGNLKLGPDASGTNQAGTNVIIGGSRGTGTGAGGSIIFQVAPAGSSGTAQNALATALTILSTGQILATNGTINYGFLPATGGYHVGSSIQEPFIQRGGSGTGGITIRGDEGYIAFSQSGVSSGTKDVLLVRDAANTLALRNGANAQTFNIYNTFTSSTNFERFRIVAQSADTVLIGTQKGSGGGTARALALQTDGTTRLTIETNGDLTIADAENIILGTTTGTKIGTATTQKIGFYNATPVVQPTAVADATDNATAITQLNALLSRMRDLGLIAT